MQMRILEQTDRTHLTAMDTMECYIRDDIQGFKTVLEKIDLLFITDMEAGLLTGNSNLMKASYELLEMGPEYVIVKKGGHGSILVSKDRIFTVPAYPVENVIDPTGAGDSFAGGAMGYLAKTNSHGPEDIIKAVVYGGITASFCVEDFSIERLKKITFADVDERLSHFRSITSF